MWWLRCSPDGGGGVVCVSGSDGGCDDGGGGGGGGSGCYEINGGSSIHGFDGGFLRKYIIYYLLKTQEQNNENQ